MRKFILSLIVLLLSNLLEAQNRAIPANTFQSKENVYYWKNRKPYEGYWQQDVHYVIDANINEKTSIIDGTEILIYTNNSPDELAFVYFHLYQNAFQPDSYYDRLMLQNGVKSPWTKYEAAKLGTVVSQLQQNGVDLKSELDNTILKVYLNKPLKSGESTEFEIAFKTYFGEAATRRRMKKYNSFGSIHYNGNHFYPRISAYDKKFGWDTQQHLGREFYGDFGQYDVSLTFSSNYVVEATGVLQNRAEVLPDSLRKALDIGNFANKPWNSKPSIIAPYDSLKRKTWKYQAINVHDFAFTADPNYRIGESNWNGIQVISIVPEPHAGYWQKAASFGAKVIEANSRDFGMYAYPKMVIADADDGMEYPMLTLNRGYDPNYRATITHEIGHNWYFGMVGNNETYRAALDEGFTQFLTAWTLGKVDGKYLVATAPKNKYEKKHTDPSVVRYVRAYYPYMKDALKNETMQLNTHSDDFNGALLQGGGYREVYYKTATMLYNLQYVLGDSLFLKAMQHYFNQWKICHPYFEDFRNSITEYTHVDLNWFFDEWLETTKTIDYAVKSIKKASEKDNYLITFKRKDNAQMPIDFSVLSTSNKVYNFHIPNTWFVKETQDSVLPAWIGWGKKLNPTYTAHVLIPEGISDVQIDPSHRLGDYNMLNNSLNFPVRFRFDHQIENDPVWEKYELFARPDLWYNGFDGLKAGINFNGNYMQTRHIFDACLWLNTGVGQQIFSRFKKDFNPISFRVNYKTSLRNFSKKFNVMGTALYLDGLQSFKLGIEKFSNLERTRFYFYFKTMLRADSSDLNYLIYKEEWQIAKQNNTVNFGLDHNYYYRLGNGKINLAARSSAFTKDYNYSTISLNVVNKTRIGKFDLRTRIFAQYGIGANFPNESALFLAGANPEEMMDNKFVRSTGFFPSDWQGFGTSINHFQYGGGLNLRGFAGYTPVEFSNNTQRKIHKGTSGAALNAELSFIRLFKTPYAKIKNYLGLDSYLFGDAGAIDFQNENNNQTISNLRMDAGLGFLLTVKKWGVLDKPSPLTLRFDMPLFVNRPPFEESDYFKFRWLLAISKSF